jgi:hypothetical protein
VSPRTHVNLALGLLLGFGYAVVRNQLDRRIRSAAAVGKQFGVTLMGAVPDSSALAHAADERAPLAVTGQAASAAEAFRKLRTNLAFMDIDNPPKIIVVTSHTRPTASPPSPPTWPPRSRFPGRRWSCSTEASAGLRWPPRSASRTRSGLPTC